MGVQELEQILKIDPLPPIWHFFLEMWASLQQNLKQYLSKFEMEHVKVEEGQLVVMFILYSVGKYCIL